MPIRVVLAEDQYLVREGIRRLLDSQDGLEVVAVGEDLDSLLAAVDAERPDVVVTDIRMPPDSSDEGIRAAARLRERTRTSASSSSASTRRPPTFSHSSTVEARAARISSRSV